MHVLHKPNDVSLVVLAHKKKLELADVNSNDSPVQAGSSSDVAPPEDEEPAPSSHAKPGSSFTGTTPMASAANPDPEAPIAMGGTTASLLLVRPIINAAAWSPSNQILDLEGDQLEIKQTRNWFVVFPGRLGNDEISFFAMEKDLGQNLAGDRNRCMILTEGATKLLEGYRSDGKALRDHLPDGTNSMIKIHLDLFQMNFDGPMPKDDEIACDLLVRSTRCHTTTAKSWNKTQKARRQKH